MKAGTNQSESIFWSGMAGPRDSRSLVGLVVAPRKMELLFHDTCVDEVVPARVLIVYYVDSHKQPRLKVAFDF